MNKLLSIVIPTYNRANYLVDNLHVLMPQIKKYKDKVDFIVSCNACTDDTANQLEDLMKIMNYRFEYYVHPNKMDVEDHFYFVASKAYNSRYMIILGDDDILSPNLLDIIIPIIDVEKEYGILHWNILLGNQYCDNNSLNDAHYSKVIETLNPMDFIRRTKFAPSFISSSIINMKCWNAGLHYDVSKCYGYQFLAIFYLGIVELKMPCLYYYFPLVIQRRGAHDWISMWPLYAVVGLSNICKMVDKRNGNTVLIDWLFNEYISPYDVLPIVYQNKEIYKLHYDEMVAPLNHRQKLFFDFWMNVPFPKLWNVIYNKCRSLF